MRKYLILKLAIAIISLFLVAGCSNSHTSVTSSENIVPDDNSCATILFKGSFTLSHVITHISNNFIEKYETWDKVDPNFPHEKIEIFLSGGGSGAGVKSIIDSSANFGMVSRNVRQEEKERIEGYQEFKLGQDALTISVNPLNNVYKVKDNISIEELRKIFSGEYKFWDDLDNRLPHEEIVLVTRDIGGGANEVFQKTVMGNLEVSDNVIQAPSMGILVSKIIENKNAIGYASYGVVYQNQGKLIPLKVDGVAPTKENIMSGAYKICRPLLIITDGNMNELEKTLINYITSDEGMKVISDLGFVPAK